MTIVSCINSFMLKSEQDLRMINNIGNILHQKIAEINIIKAKSTSLYQTGELLKEEYQFGVMLSQVCEKCKDIINNPDSLGRTALDLTFEIKNAQICNWLVEVGADPSHLIKMCISNGIAREHMDLFRSLLTETTVNCEYQEGQTPLSLALDECLDFGLQNIIIYELIINGADLTFFDPVEKKTCIQKLTLRKDLVLIENVIHKLDKEAERVLKYKKDTYDSMALYTALTLKDDKTFQRSDLISLVKMYASFGARRTKEFKSLVANDKDLDEIVNKCKFHRLGRGHSPMSPQSLNSEAGAFRAERTPETPDIFETEDTSDFTEQLCNLIDFDSSDSFGALPFYEISSILPEFF